MNVYKEMGYTYIHMYMFYKFLPSNTSFFPNTFLHLHTFWKLNSLTGNESQTKRIEEENKVAAQHPLGYLQVNL